MQLAQSATGAELSDARGSAANNGKPIDGTVSVTSQ